METELADFTIHLSVLLLLLMTLALVLQRGESKHEMAEYHAKILFHLIMRLLSFLV